MKTADTAIILAGGQSSRMGYDKDRLMIGGTRLVDMLSSSLQTLFGQVVLVSNSPGYSPPAGVWLVADELPGMGPLGGIHAGLKAAHSQYCFVTACDMPNLNLAYVDFLRTTVLSSTEEISVLATQYEQHMEPFTAFYNRDLVPAIESYCRNGGRGLNSFLRRQGVALIPESVAREFSPDWSMFANLNTPKQHRDYIESRP